MLKINDPVRGIKQQFAGIDDAVCTLKWQVPHPTMMMTFDLSIHVCTRERLATAMTTVITTALELDDQYHSIMRVRG